MARSTHSARTPSPARDARSVAVAGLGRFGGALALELESQRMEVLRIDADEDTVQSFDGLLILMDAILVLVLCLLLYALSAREPLARSRLFDALQLVLAVAALALDAVMLSAMLARIAEFGSSPNKIAALGLNLLLLVHLARARWLTLGFLRGRCPFGALER